MDAIVDTSGGSILAVRVTPRAGRDEIGDEADGWLRVRVAAPPVEGAANEAVLRLLAARLGVPRRSLQLLSGETGRQKRVFCPLSADQVRRRLSRAPDPG